MALYSAPPCAVKAHTRHLAFTFYFKLLLLFMWAQEVFHSTDSHNVRLYAQTYIYIMPFNIKDAVFLSDM